jgi:hypothetical protein
MRIALANYEESEHRCLTHRIPSFSLSPHLLLITKSLLFAPPSVVTAKPAFSSLLFHDDYLRVLSWCLVDKKGGSNASVLKVSLASW